MRLAKKIDRPYTYADYCTWPDDERWELIDGVAYALTFAMGPAPVRRHQLVVVEMVRQIANALKGSPCQTYVAPFDVRLPRAGERADGAKTVLQPDISVICDRAKLDDRGCVGAPDWVIEVLSPATASRDQIAKRRAYEMAGVREFWLVHPVDRVVTVYLLESSGDFGRPEIYELLGTLASVVLPAVAVDWDQLPAEDA